MNTLDIERGRPPRTTAFVLDFLAGIWKNSLRREFLILLELEIINSRLKLIRNTRDTKCKCSFKKSNLFMG